MLRLYDCGQDEDGHDEGHSGEGRINGGGEEGRDEPLTDAEEEQATQKTHGEEESWRAALRAVETFDDEVAQVWFPLRVSQFLAWSYVENLNPHLISGSGSKSVSVSNVVLHARFCQMVAALPRVCKNCGTHYTEGESEGQGCRYHPGARKLDNAWNSIWTCCGQKHTARGCVPRIRMHQDHH